MNLRLCKLKLTLTFYTIPLTQFIGWHVSHHAPDISKMVSALGTFFRHSLNKGNEYTTIENELNQISSYVSIQKIRFEDKFDVVYDIDENLLHCTIVKLTIQPLVENSIIHGFDEIEEGGMITIRIYPEDDIYLLMLLIMVAAQTLMS